MRLTHVVHAYTPSIGGSQILIQRVSEELVQQYGHAITVLTSTARNLEHFWDAHEPGLPTGKEMINGVDVQRLAVFNRLGPLWRILAGVAYRLGLPGNDWLRTAQQGPWLRGLADAIRTSQPDVILAATFPLHHMYQTARIARQLGKPLVLLGALHLADAWGYDRPMIYRAIRAADGYIALSQHERDVLVEQHRVRPERIQVIGGGIDLSTFAQASATLARQKFGLGDAPDAPMVLSIGKHTERKRFDLLIQAMSTVWRTLPTAHLVIAGAKTAYTTQLEYQIAQLPHASQIHLLSDVETDDKVNLLAACDVFALASGDESFGIVFVEAWACGKPVVGANRGAIPSIIHNEVDGLVFDYPNPQNLAEKLLYLLNNPQLAHSLGQSGHAKTRQQYTWSQIAHQYHNFYQSTSPP